MLRDEPMLKHAKERERKDWSLTAFDLLSLSYKFLQEGTDGENYEYVQPTVDAVPVIRCKDCRFFDSGICHAEDERAYDLSENHYCGFGEPKENEHE